MLPDAHTKNFSLKFHSNAPILIQAESHNYSFRVSHFVTFFIQIFAPFRLLWHGMILFLFISVDVNTHFIWHRSTWGVLREMRKHLWSQNEESRCSPFIRIGAFESLITFSWAHNFTTINATEWETHTATTRPNMTVPLSIIWYGNRSVCVFAAIRKQCYVCIPRNKERKKTWICSESLPNTDHPFCIASLTTPAWSDPSNRKIHIYFYCLCVHVSVIFPIKFIAKSRVGVCDVRVMAQCV